MGSVVLAVLLGLSIAFGLRGLLALASGDFRSGFLFAACEFVVIFASVYLLSRAEGQEQK